MELNKLIHINSIEDNIKAKTKVDVVKKLAKIASKNPACDDVETSLIAKLLQDREDQGSTGFGNDIAIPHARIPGMKDFIIVIARSNKGVDFEAMDKKKVKLFFVILGPEDSVNEHLQILAALSRFISQTQLKNELLNVKSEQAMFETFQKYTIEEQQESTKEKQKMKLMMITLYLDEFLYHILEYFIQENIDGASIIESAGMGQYISNIPLFATFIGFMNERKNQSKTIMTMIPADQEEKLIKGIELITGDLNKKQGAMIMTLDVSFYKGSMKML